MRVTRSPNVRAGLAASGSDPAADCRRSVERRDRRQWRDHPLPIPFDAPSFRRARRGRWPNPNSTGPATQPRLLATAERSTNDRRNDPGGTGSLLVRGSRLAAMFVGMVYSPRSTGASRRSLAPRRPSAFGAVPARQAPRHGSRQPLPHLALPPARLGDGHPRTGTAPSTVRPGGLVVGRRNLSFAVDWKPDGEGAAGTESGVDGKDTPVALVYDGAY
jgi:hypothetical protein